jgi:carboxymethylenebutenolidase
MHKDINIDGVPAYHSYPEDGKKHPGLIVIHEIWGLVPHIKDVADRFAKEGYSVIAPNLFHEMTFEGRIIQTIFDEMQDPATRDEAQKKMREITAPIHAPEFGEKTLARLEECVKYLVEDSHVTTEEVGVVGFCFGGTYSLALAALDPRITAAVSFYGHPLKEEKISDLNCPILAFYGDQDSALLESLPAFRGQMKKHNKDFTAVVYPDTGHAFFNDTNARRYDKKSAEDAWDKTLKFLKNNLAS